jgi:pSer/pThr/pTyr-binding forkhead associated (FHA) protein
MEYNIPYLESSSIYQEIAMEVKLVFIRKDRTTQSFPLPSAVTFIGRRQDCDLCIPLSMVSRRHCEVYSEFNKIMVRDLKSRNGTFVNHESIEEAQVKAGDTLRVGPIHFIVQIDGVPENFDEFLPPEGEQPAERQTTAPSQDETQEADFDDILKSLSSDSTEQSQTMDIDDVFTNGFLDDDDFDLDSDLA